MNPAPCSMTRKSTAVNERRFFAVFISASFTWVGVQSGWAWRRRTAAPATCGAAIDVPLNDPYPVALTSNGTAATTEVPGAETSGLISRSVVGPRELPPETCGPALKFSTTMNGLARMILPFACDTVKLGTASAAVLNSPAALFEMINAAAPAAAAWLPLLTKVASSPAAPPRDASTNLPATLFPAYAAGVLPKPTSTTASGSPSNAAGSGAPYVPPTSTWPVAWIVVRGKLAGRASALPVAMTSGEAPYMFGR